MDEIKTFAQAMETALTSETELPERSTEGLDLTTLPARLDDRLMGELEKIARSSPPPPIPCERQQFDYCLRMMLAVLPRRQADDLAGELFVAAYEQALWRYSEHAMQYLTQRAIAEKKWFPTVKECLDILEDWRRPQADYQDHAKRQNLAEAAIRAEREARAEERREEGRKFLAKLRAGEVPQAEIDALHDSVVFEFRKLGVLRWNRETEKFEAVKESIA